jgi:hypothetical protein
MYLDISYNQIKSLQNINNYEFPKLHHFQLTDSFRYCYK